MPISLSPHSAFALSLWHILTPLHIPYYARNNLQFALSCTQYYFWPHTPWPNYGAGINLWGNFMKEGGNVSPWQILRVSARQWTCQLHYILSGGGGGVSTARAQSAHDREKLGFCYGWQYSWLYRPYYTPTMLESLIMQS